SLHPSTRRAGLRGIRLPAHLASSATALSPGILRLLERPLTVKRFVLDIACPPAKTNHRKLLE
ncbi:MAG: hypothetical protein M3380_14495, partial [Chloroflexota bacterium]|nr:hypothetical protein [Chloroflexota bacterium]